MLVPIVFGVGAILMGAFFVWKGYSSPKQVAAIENNWKVVSGKLTKVNYRKTQVDSSLKYVFDVEYEYDNGRTGTTVYPSMLGSHNEHTKETVEAFTDKWSAGDKVDIYVNPDDETETCLAVVDITDAANGNKTAIALGVVFALFGLVFIAAGL